MSNVLPRFVGLCLPAIAFCLLDDSLTLIGQSKAYWSGAYSQVNEGSPIFNHLLALHPLAFVAGSLVWIGAFTALILLLPDTLALIVCIGVTLGHSVGAATWILFRFKFGYQACNGLFLLAAIALGVGICWGWRARPIDEYRLPLVLEKLRWILVAALFALAAWVFLWPRGV